jgi:hypothetical protein
VQELGDKIAGHSRVVFFDGARHECLIRADPRKYAEAVVPLLRAVRERR